MDARRSGDFFPRRSTARLLLFSAAAILLLGTSTAAAQPMFRQRAPQRMMPATAHSAPVVTTNFVVSAPDARFAQQAAELAEQYRKQLAIEWLGHELPAWQQPCPIEVRFERLAGGETSFAFISNGPQTEPVEWTMTVFGPPERILDSVLPHEITHTIFATHFGRPLPRWADEGACTTVEHESERRKNHQMLIDFLTAKPASRGIPFNRMFLMRDYPHDILPLYAQGYSLARFLIMRGGRQQFVKYVGAGLQAEQPGQELDAWNNATNRFYGFEDLSDLQIQWLSWVKQGSPDHVAPQADAIAMNVTNADNTTYTSTSPPPASIESQRMNQVISGNSPPVYQPGSIANYDPTLWRYWEDASTTTLKTSLTPVLVDSLPRELQRNEPLPEPEFGRYSRSASSTLWR